MTRNMIMLTSAAVLAVGGLLASSRADDQKDKSAKLDQLLIRAQKICPVSGRDLTSMGRPVKATSGGRTLFLCCKGCLGKQIPKENWAKVQVNMIAAQGKCPVLGRPLPKDAKSALVKGRTIYVCCPPCTKKIAADPDKYLAAVNDLLEARFRKD